MEIKPALSPVPFVSGSSEAWILFLLCLERREEKNPPFSSPFCRYDFSPPINCDSGSEQRAAVNLFSLSCSMISECITDRLTVWLANKFVENSEAFLGKGEHGRFSSRFPKTFHGIIWLRFSLYTQALTAANCDDYVWPAKKSYTLLDTTWGYDFQWMVCARQNCLVHPGKSSLNYSRNETEHTYLSNYRAILLSTKPHPSVLKKRNLDYEHSHALEYRILIIETEQGSISAQRQTRSDSVQATAACFTCEPVEYLPGVRDPDVFPEPMELSVLFPLQQCVRRHFPYSLRT